jgi:hypothetical protein
VTGFDSARGVPYCRERIVLEAGGVVVIVQFDGDKVEQKRLSWDQASVLVQIGLLDRTLPVRGDETVAQVLNSAQPMNELIHRAFSNSVIRGRNGSQ